jgi:hypothetical protein
MRAHSGQRAACREKVRVFHVDTWVAGVLQGRDKKGRLRVLRLDDGITGLYEENFVRRGLH